MDIAASAAHLEAGDISRRKKVKEKRPSPFLFNSNLLPAKYTR